jgi:hypothetical protein
MRFESRIFTDSIVKPTTINVEARPRKVQAVSWPAAVPEHSRIVAPASGHPAERERSRTLALSSFGGAARGSNTADAPFASAASRRCASTSTPATTAPRPAAIWAA